MDRKVVLVTGSGKGIGRACIEAFAEKGYDVVINYNYSEEQAAELEKIIKEKYKVDAIRIKSDVSNEDDVSHMIEQINERFGRIDVVVNNTGIEIIEPFEEKSVEHFRKTIDTNLIGTFLVSKYASKYMNKGSIINVSSTSGLDAFSPFSMDYNASKAAIISLTHDLAIQLQPNIRVNAVAPGWVDTDMNKDLPKDFLNEEIDKTCVKFMAEPKDIANVVVFLASEEARYINSEVIKIDGGIQ